MKYISTRGCAAVSAAEAIVRGLAPDGGLYVPEEIPAFSAEELRSLAEKPYGAAARMILAKYLDDFTAAEIEECVAGAYESGAFEADDVISLVPLKENLSVMELFWGPTSAFKDVALQLMPRLLVKAAHKLNERDNIAIVVATSGDTGKAALEGFCDVEDTSITVVYPADGVSELQRRQMVTQRGDNTRVIALEGNFDDAQTAVKKLFSDNDAREKLAGRGVKLSSANSINWGRLLPQIVYYSVVSARLSKGGGTVDFIVPTGNFGNILAAYYAKRMGASIGRLTVACNQNDVLADFVESGVYNAKRPFYRTLSPSMDILVSSNLERLLFELSGRDAALVRGYMGELNESGRYEADGALMGALRETFSASRCDDALTRETVAKTWRDFSYLCDPHTATALAEGYKSDCYRPTVVAATASPYKFPAAVYGALFGEEALGGADDYAALDMLAEATRTAVPARLGELAALPVRHNEKCKKDELVNLLAETL